MTPGEDWGPALNTHRIEAGYPVLSDIESTGVFGLSPVVKQNVKGDDPPGYEAAISGAAVIETSS